MANLYGVANAPGPIAFYNNPGNITCPAGVETNVITSPALIAGSQGFFSCLITGVLAIVMQATPPTALTVGFRFGAGADFSGYSFAGQFLTANGAVFFPLLTYTGNLQNTWYPPGAIINVTINPTAQPVFGMQGSYAFFNLLRSPDQ